MFIEYKIQLGPDGVTVTQCVDPDCSTTSGDPNAPTDVSSQGSLPMSYPGSGGAGNPKGGPPGGAGNPKGGPPGGAGNPKGGPPGGAGNPKGGPPGGGGFGCAPVIIFGPIILGGTAGCGCGQMPGGGLCCEFDMQPQLESNWCWAAVSVSVDHYFSPLSTTTQCYVAGKVTGLDCCGGVGDCDLPERLEDALQVVNINPVIDPPLTFDAVRQQIDAGRPVCVRIGWPDQQRGHFVVICGYRELTSCQQLLAIADPFYAGSTIDFGEFNTNYQGGGQWTDSYLV